MNSNIRVRQLDFNPRLRAQGGDGELYEVAFKHSSWDGRGDRETGRRGDGETGRRKDLECATYECNLVLGERHLDGETWVRGKICSRLPALQCPRVKASGPIYPASRLKKLPAGVGIALLNLGLLIAPVVIPTPAQGAEQIYLTYGPLEFSLPIQSLATYARLGKIDRYLAVYANRLNQQQLEQLRKILTTRVDVKPLAIAQFLYSPQGKTILEKIGQIIQTKAGQPGFYAIRAALIQAAGSPEGLTLLSVLEKFPTYGIRINSAEGFQLMEELSNLSQRTQLAIAAVEQQSASEAAAGQLTAPSNPTLPKILDRESNYFSRLPDLRKPGETKYAMQTLTLYDTRRQREFVADLYLPQQSSRPAPLVVISHGLGSDRTTFAYLAAHLASYGFAVAVPEHPGSNADQLQALINGLANEVTPPAELIDRPLDIKFLLDELQRSFAGRINLQQVGVLGQSFGGYTTLALAGAKINFEQLAKDCGRANISLNLSLLLQCRASELLTQDYQLADQRIKAGIAINPIGSTIFGKSQLSQIQLPLMVVAGSDDTVAPALPEQIQPFTWLTTPNKYLVLIKKGTHFSTLEETVKEGVPIPPQVIGSNPEIAQAYMKALSVAFFQTYIVNNPDYRVYLSASYSQYLSQYPLPLSLVQSLTEEQLMQATKGEISTPEPMPSPTPLPTP